MKCRRDDPIFLLRLFRLFLQDIYDGQFWIGLYNPGFANCPDLAMCKDTTEFQDETVFGDLPWLNGVASDIELAVGTDGPSLCMRVMWNGNGDKLRIWNKDCGHEMYELCQFDCKIGNYTAITTPAI